VDQVLTWLLDAVQSVDPLVRVLIVGFAMMCETSILIGLIVPGDTVVIVAATAVTTPLQGVAIATAAVVGALIGESIGYALGKFLGPKIRMSRLGRRIGEHNWLRAENYLQRRGGIAIFLSRFLPVLHSLVPLTVGMSGYSYRRFLAWTTPACVIWAALYVTVSALASGTYRDLSGEIHFAGYVFVGIIVVFVVLVYVVKKVIGRAERKHLATYEEPTGAASDVTD